LYQPILKPSGVSSIFIYLFEFGKTGKMLQNRFGLLFAVILLSTDILKSDALSMKESGVSRRMALSTAFGISAIVTQAQPSFAGSSPPTPAELDRVRLGYKQIQYLLSNFESETTVCRENGGECKRDAEPIRRVLGLRSTTDPLFQIDKVFEKVKNMDIDGDQLEDFFEASEDWNSAMSLSNSMAFIQYLLSNFESETTVCRENGGECKRDAEPIRRVLGLRSTTDPLFQIDKVFEKVKNMDIDGDQLEDFFEASEDWNSAMSLSNSMAFISQFGEYNPGGGKDSVLKYLNESKTQVELASKSLKTIMECLGIAE
jgi:hypothetical protein